MTNVVKAANAFPLKDFPYFNTYPLFSKLMGQKKNQLLSFMTCLGKNHNKKYNFVDGSDDHDRFDRLVDFNDFLLDRVGHSLDDVEGLKKKNEALVLATLQKPVGRLSTGTSSTATNGEPSIVKKYQLLASKIVERPQVSFPDKIDNSDGPFIPILKDKPNCLKPLSILPEQDAIGNVVYPNPYEFEIEMFEPLDVQLSEREPIPAKCLDETPLIMVDSIEKFKKMMTDMKSVKEIAVDLEHHSYRTFQGFTCLIQISTRNTDYIIDALKLRGHLETLNEIFTNPSIVKVLHGAESDIIWLQRDFGVYIVNLFDTFFASKTLGLARHSLAHLLKSFCNLEVNKEFQLADWRIRPLDDEMIKYARQDTHYLLYLYDVLSNELLKRGNESRNLLRSVYTKSSLLCLSTYRKPAMEKDAHLSILRKSGILLNARQLFALEQLYRWRDKLAREEDESYGYILPNHMMLQLAQSLPREIQGILACCNPVPPLVKQHLNELNLMILKAREQPLDSLAAKKRQSMPYHHQLVNSSVINLDNDPQHDYCHIDIEHAILDADGQEEMDVELTQQRSSKRKKEKSSALFKFFTVKRKKRLQLPVPIMSPFERYKKALEMDKDKKKTLLDKDERILVGDQEETKRNKNGEDSDDSSDSSIEEIPLERSEEDITAKLQQARETFGASRTQRQIELKKKSKKAKKEVIPHTYSEIELNVFKNQPKQHQGSERRGGHSSGRSRGTRRGRGNGRGGRRGHHHRGPKQISITYTK